MDNHQITFEHFDLNNQTHTEAFFNLLKHYMQDPMGDSQALDEKKQAELISLFSQQSNAASLFLKINNEFVGLVNYFYLISTFKAKPYIYIHDVIVHNKFRGKGLGRELIEEIIAIAKEKDCCKIMLEVRDDNAPALSLYNSLGFIDSEPKNYSWTKLI